MIREASRHVQIRSHIIFYHKTSDQRAIYVLLSVGYVLHQLMQCQERSKRTARIRSHDGLVVLARLFLGL